MRNTNQAKRRKWREVLILIISFLNNQPYITLLICVFSHNQISGPPVMISLQSNRDLTCRLCRYNSSEQFQTLSCGHAYCYWCLVIIHVVGYCVSCECIKDMGRLLFGDQPNGYMSWRTEPNIFLPGNDDYGTIIISCNFDRGVQGTASFNYGLDKNPTIKKQAFLWLYNWTLNRVSFKGNRQMFILFFLVAWTKWVNSGAGSHEIRTCRLGTSRSMAAICVVLSALIFCLSFVNVFFVYRANAVNYVDIPCIIISRGLVFLARIVGTFRINFSE